MKLQRLRERAASIIIDIDAFYDAQVSDEQKTIIKYHLYLVVNELDGLTAKA